MTQTEFAEAIDIPLSTLQKHEGGNVPQKDSLIELTRKLGLASETSLFLDPDLVPESDDSARLRLIADLASLDHTQLDLCFDVVREAIDAAMRTKPRFGGDGDDSN